MSYTILVANLDGFKEGDTATDKELEPHGIEWLQSVGAIQSTNTPKTIKKDEE